MDKQELIGAFTCAVEGGDLEAVRRISTDNPDLFAGTSITINSYLEDAARADNPAMMSLLVELGADINAPLSKYDPEGVIQTAAGNGSVNVVRWLLERGAKINHEVDGDVRCSALNQSVIDGHFEVVKLLVAAGAVFHDGKAVNIARMYGKKEIEQYLLSVSADGAEQSGDETSRTKGRPVEKDPWLQHITAHFGPPDRMAIKEIVPSDPAISLHFVNAGFSKVLVTKGMSSKPLTASKTEPDLRFVELLMLLPHDWPTDAEAFDDPRYSWPAEWMRRIALHAHQKGASLGNYAIFTNGKPAKPFASNTDLSCLLVLRSLESYGTLTLPDGKQVAFYNVMPIYREEHEILKQAGIGELLQRFEQHQISRVLDVARKNVAK